MLIICVGIVWILYIYIYFLFEKQAFNGLLKVISKQIYLQKMIERNNNLFHINVIIQCTFYIYVIPKSE